MGNHVRVTPTSPLPAPDWRGRRERAEAAVAGAAAFVATRTPTPPPQALLGEGGLGEVRAWPKPKSLPSRGAQTPLSFTPRLVLREREAAQVYCVACHRDHQLNGRQGRCYMILYVVEHLRDPRPE